MGDFTIADIATILTSVGAVLSMIAILYKVRAENKKLLSEGSKADADADLSYASVDKSHAETYALLSKQLKEAYEEIDKLRANQEKISWHRDYQDYLLRCIARLTNQLSARDLTPVCMPISFDEFMLRKEQNGG